MSRTKITKGIVRKIQTKQFENVDISVSVEEEIEWENDKQRQEKIDLLTKKLLDDFKSTYNEVCNTLEVDRCIGVISTDADTKKKNKNKNSLEETKNEDGSFDFWGA